MPNEMLPCDTDLVELIKAGPAQETLPSSKSLWRNDHHHPKALHSCALKPGNAAAITYQTLPVPVL